MSAERLGLDAETLVRLERLSIAANVRVRGSTLGKRRSRRTGSSLDFADYRLYAPGDDVRQIDWNAYGRSGKPFVKLFHDEQELPLRLWVDASASMNTGGEGTSGDNKLLYAKRLAACVGYMALCGYDRVSAFAFAREASGALPPLRGKGSAQRLFRFLADVEPEKKGDMYRSLAQPKTLPRGPGLTWIFSDFLYETGVRETLNVLLAAKQQLVVVQVLSPEELDPRLAGDVRLIDVETDAGKEVSISPRVLRAYREALEAHVSALKAFCRERHIAYALASTDVPAAAWAASALRGAGALV